MKKVIAVVTLLSLAVAFSCAVSAAGVAYNTSVHRVYNLEDGVVADITARALYPTAEVIQGDSQYVDYSTVTWKCVLTLIIKNKTSQNKYIKNINPVLYLDLPSSPTGQGSIINYNAIVDIENFSSDLYFTTGSENYLLWTQASSDWSFLDGFVVTPNSCITAVSVVSFPAYYYETGNLWKYSTLTDVQITNDRSSETTYYTPDGSNDDVLLSLDTLRTYLMGANGIALIDSDLDTVNTLLSDIKTILQANTSTNTNISNDSQSLKTSSDNIHAQEASWFQQNSNAIAATGLSNYQFNGGTVAGVNSVTNDFVAVWNALGSWTSVYIFSLTLALALTIIRHVPSGVNSVRASNRRAEAAARYAPRHGGHG